MCTSEMKKPTVVSKVQAANMHFAWTQTSRLDIYPVGRRSGAHKSGRGAGGHAPPLRAQANQVPMPKEARGVVTSVFVPQQ